MYSIQVFYSYQELNLIQELQAYEVMIVLKYTFKYDIHYHCSNIIVGMQRCEVVANLKWMQEKYLKIRETAGIENPKNLHDSLGLENLVKWKSINVMEDAMKTSSN